VAINLTMMQYSCINMVKRKMGWKGFRIFWPKNLHLYHKFVKILSKITTLIARIRLCKILQRTHRCFNYFYKVWIKWKKKGNWWWNSNNKWMKPCRKCWLNRVWIPSKPKKCFNKWKKNRLKKENIWWIKNRRKWRH